MSEAPTRTASLKGGKALADLYGVTYDADVLEAKFNDASKAQYAASRKEYANTENKYYNNMYGNQQTALDTMRKNNAAAVATGASRGMQAANELSAILGLQQQSTETATQLAQDRNLLMDKEYAAYAANASKALETSNALAMQLGNLDANIYAADTQFDVGSMDYYANLYTADANLAGMKAQADSNRYTADQNLAGNRYTADQMLLGNQYTANANLAGNKYTADQNLLGNKYTADSSLTANKYTADQNLAGTKYNSDKYLEGNKYSADKNYAGTVYSSDQNLAATKYNADLNYKAQQAAAAATIQAANISAAAQKAAAASSSYSAGNQTLDAAVKTNDRAAFIGYMTASGTEYDNAVKEWELRQTIEEEVKKAADPKNVDVVSGAGYSNNKNTTNNKVTLNPVGTSILQTWNPLAR